LRHRCARLADGPEASQEITRRLAFLAGPEKKQVTTGATIDYWAWPCYRLSVVKRLAISITLILFFSSSSLASLETLSAGFDAHSQPSIWAVDHDFSAENARGRRALKRLQTGKSSLKTLPAVGKPARDTFLIAWIKQTSFSLRSPKSSVYQQLNVYRI
jgi:hypothetical protein